MLRGVGAPGPPALGAGEQRAGRRPRCRPRRPARAAGRCRAAGTRRARAARASRCTARSTRRCRAARAGARSRPSRLRRGAEESRDRRRRPRASAASVAARARGMPSAREVGRREPLGRGKTCGQPVVACRCACERLAVARDELAGEPIAAADGDLLAEHGAHRELEAVPGARHAQARARRDERRERGILARGARRSPAGSAARSNTRRTRAMIAGSADSRREADRSRAARRPAAGSHRDRRRARRRARSCARSASPRTTSTPGIARAARKAIIAAQSYGGR